MIDSTKSLKILKNETQRILDFAVLICYSVPGLKKLIRGYNEKIEHFDKFHNPDYFKEENHDLDRLESVSKHYKENLSKYLLLSAFSFFEAYFRNVFDELVEFHGGIENLIGNAKNRRGRFLSSQDNEILEHKRKLQEPLKKSKWMKYRKHQSVLEENSDFRFPSELISSFGLKTLIETVQGNSFKSVLIPELLEDALGLSLDDKINHHEELKDKDLKETFDIIRNLRNEIGHGNSGKIGFLKVMDLIRYLRFLAVKIDNHLVENFFILEDYRRAN